MDGSHFGNSPSGADKPALDGENSAMRKAGRRKPRVYARQRVVYRVKNAGQVVHGDNHAQTQHFHVGGAFLPLGEMTNDQLKCLLSELGEAARSERRALNVVYTVIAFCGPLFVLYTMDWVESRPSFQPTAAAALSFIACAFSVGLWSIRAAPWSEWLQARRDTITELNSPRRAVLVEIALRRARGEWPSHWREFLRFVFVGSESK